MAVRTPYTQAKTSSRARTNRDHCMTPGATENRPTLADSLMLSTQRDDTTNDQPLTFREDTTRGHKLTLNSELDVTSPRLDDHRREALMSAPDQQYLEIRTLEASQLQDLINS